MKVVIATDLPEENEFFTAKFFAKGYHPYNALSEIQLLNIIKQKKVEMLILDFDSDKYEKLETIKKVKLENNDIIIILLTYKSDFEFVKKSNELGIFAIIPKLEDLSKQFQEILTSLENLGKRKEEKRKFVRVKPDETMRNFVHMKIPGIQTIYHGKIKDISLGGLLASFSTEISDSLLYQGKSVIISADLELITFKVESLTILKRGFDVALRFKGLTEVNRNNLSRYILTRID